MMSIPTSVILVVLVAAWLVVLVPMVARRREPVPETDMDGGTFRVLRRASATMRRRPKLSRRDDLGGDDINEHLDENDSTDAEEWVPAPSGDQFGTDSDGDADYEQTDSGVEELPVELEPRRSSVGRGGGGAEAGVVEPDRYQTEPPAARFGEPHGVGSHPYRAESPEWETSFGNAAALEMSGPPEPEDDDFQAEYGWPEDDVTGGKFGDEPVGPRAHRSDEIDAGKLRPVPRRSGRGGYDPDAAEMARAYRYSRRRRVTVILLLIAIVCGAAAYLVKPVLWSGSAFVGLLLVAYLGYLRRQVRIEKGIRERRLARLRRARQIRPEYHADGPDSPITGSSFGRPGVPVSQGPTSGYRRGREIVDVEDDDPTFDDLEYYEPAVYRRAAGQ